MGDLIEFSTWPHKHNAFYKIKGSAVTFSVKGDGQAAVGLAKRPDKECECWIVIDNNWCWIEKNGSHANTQTDAKAIPILISRHVYNKFWISWHSSQVQFGLSSDGLPIVSKKIITEGLKFVTFSVHANGENLHWKLFLPPKLEKPLQQKVTGGEMKWVDADVQLPPGAFIGGYEKEILYIIRAPHQGSLTPGKYVPSLGLGFISWDGRTHEKHQFQVLCGYNCIWVPTSGNRIPVGAVEGGYSEDNNEILYVARAVQDNYLIPGKLHPSYLRCFFPYKGRECGNPNFEILVDPEIFMNSPHCSNVSHMNKNTIT